MHGRSLTIEKRSFREIWSKEQWPEREREEEDRTTERARAVTGATTRCWFPRKTIQPAAMSDSDDASSQIDEAFGGRANLPPTIYNSCKLGFWFMLFLPPWISHVCLFASCGVGARSPLGIIPFSLGPDRPASTTLHSLLPPRSWWKQYYSKTTAAAAKRRKGGNCFPTNVKMQGWKERGK